jgi:hypothetical protein
VDDAIGSSAGTGVGTSKKVEISDGTTVLFGVAKISAGNSLRGAGLAGSSTGISILVSFRTG